MCPSLRIESEKYSKVKLNITLHTVIIKKLVFYYASNS